MAVGSPGPNCSWFCSCLLPASSLMTSDPTAPLQVRPSHVLYTRHNHLCSCFLLRSYNGCVSDSTTARHLHNSGVIAVSQQAWSKITVYTKQGFRYDLTLKRSCLTPHVYVKQALDHYILVVFSSDKLTKLPSTVCQILVELGLTLS